MREAAAQLGIRALHSSFECLFESFVAESSRVVVFPRDPCVNFVSGFAGHLGAGELASRLQTRCEIVFCCVVGVGKIPRQEFIQNSF